jgi:DNA-binding transcriptional ArsR family regulator
MDGRSTPPVSTAGLRAFAHPFRLRVLSLLTASAMSAAEVARELDTTQANASYHLRKLHAAGLLEVAEEVSIRGGKARRYRHDPSTGSSVRTSGPDDHQAVVAALSAELRRRTSERKVGVPGLLTDAELWVDQPTWDAVRAQVHSASELLHAEAVPPRTPGAIRVNATLVMFQMVDEPPGRRVDQPDPDGPVVPR